jgi:hypothetical protein
MQSETRQKAVCGPAPRKWNGTKGGHCKHRRRTDFDPLIAEHSLPHLFSQKKDEDYFSKRGLKIFFPRQEERYFSRNGEEGNTQIEKGIGGR